MNINIIKIMSLASMVVCFVAVDAHSAASGGSKVFATIDGKPLITEQQFTQAFDRILDENPQLKQMLPMIPNIKDQFLKGMVSQKVVDKYIVDNNLDKTAGYYQELNQAIDSLKSTLNTKYFTQKFPVVVSDVEIQKFYNEHKQDIPELLSSAGGVEASGIACASEAEAKQIAAAAQGKNLAQVAESAGKQSSFNNFGLVDNQSVGIDEELKTKIVTIKKFPAVMVLKATDGVFWVISATGKKEVQYLPFDKIKNELKGYLENKNRGDKINSEIERLQKEYKIVIVKDEPEAKEVATRVKKAGPRLAHSSKTLKNTRKPTKVA